MIPRATIVGTVIAAVVYIVSTVGVMSLVPSASWRPRPRRLPTRRTGSGGASAAAVIALGAAISCLGALNGWTLMAGQLPMAIAADGLFPAIFARRSARGAPVTGFVIGAVLSTMLLAIDWVQWRVAGGEGRDLVGLFTQMILLATLSTLVPYFFCSLSVVLGLGAASAAAGGRTGHGTRLIALALLCTPSSRSSAPGTEVLLWGLVLIAAGVPVYFWMARRRATSPAA